MGGNNKRTTQLSTDFGIEPTRGLPNMSNFVNAVQLPIDSGTVPTKKLSDKSTT